MRRVSVYRDDIAPKMNGLVYIEIEGQIRCYFKDRFFIESELMDVRRIPLSEYEPDETSPAKINLRHPEADECHVYVYDIRFTFRKGKLVNCKRFCYPCC